MPKNKELQEKLAAHESECRATEDKMKYHPKKTFKNTTIIGWLFNHKRKEKLSKIIKDITAKAFNVDKVLEDIKDQKIQVVKNREKRALYEEKKNKYPESYYDDCYNKTGLPKNRHDKRKELGIIK